MKIRKNKAVLSHVIFFVFWFLVLFCQNLLDFKSDLCVGKLAVYSPSIHRLFNICLRIHKGGVMIYRFFANRRKKNE